MAPSALLATAPILLLLLSLSSPSAAKRPTPTPNPTPTPTPVPAPVCLTACPTNPLDGCDFFFQATPSTVPEFTLTAAAGSTLSLGVLKYNPAPAGFFVKNIAGNMGPGLSNVTIAGLPACSTGLSFVGSGSSLSATTTTAMAAASAFVPSCVKLTMGNVQLSRGTGQPINLNPGNTSPSYPVAKRCVYLSFSYASSA